MMNFKIILIVLVGIPALALTQPALQRELNLPRPGDKIIKQQVEFKDPGRSGKNIVWDFGNLLAINEEYRLTWHLPRLRRDSIYILGKDTFRTAEGLIVGREHGTNYFYQIKDSVLLLLGYENHTDLMHYINPLPVVKFPMRYGQKYEQVVHSENLFSSKVQMKMHGKIYMEADAWGKIVLPLGDTLQNVLRIRTKQTQLADNMKAMDSIHVNTTIETYKWYASGYRYPVFEIIKTKHKTGEVEDIFETAFFFPPQKQNILPKDIGNMAVLDSLLYAKTTNSQQQHPWDGFNYKVLPNPVINNMIIELDLPRYVDNLRIQICNPMGIIYIDEQKGAFSKGINRFTYNISKLHKGNYTLNFWLDGYMIHGNIIMKK